MPLTKREAATITAYTGILIGDISEFHKYAEEILKEPIWTHEFGDRETWDRLKEASKAEFLSICEEVSHAV
jgi:hypothetical protein